MFDALVSVAAGGSHDNANAAAHRSECGATATGTTIAGRATASAWAALVAADEMGDWDRRRARRALGHRLRDGFVQEGVGPVGGLSRLDAFRTGDASEARAAAEA